MTNEKSIDHSEVAEWENAAPSTFSLGSECPPDFDKSTNQEERDNWADNVAVALQTPPFADIDSKSHTIAVLATDRFGEWMEEIERHSPVTLIIKDVKNPEHYEGGGHDVVAIQLIEDRSDVEIILQNVSFCEYGYTATFNDLALSALEFCEFFYWSGVDDIVGQHVSVPYPPGYSDTVDPLEERASLGDGPHNPSRIVNG